MSLLLTAAEQGDVDAQFELGVSSAYCTSARLDNCNFRAWYAFIDSWQKVVLVLVRVTRGFCPENCAPVPIIKLRCNLSFLQHAAMLSLMKCHAQLMYEEGRGGTDPNDAQAFYWFNAAAAQVGTELPTDPGHPLSHSLVELFCSLFSSFLRGS